MALIINGESPEIITYNGAQVNAVYYGQDLVWPEKTFTDIPVELCWYANYPSYGEGVYQEIKLNSSSTNLITSKYEIYDADWDEQGTKTGTVSFSGTLFLRAVGLTMHLEEDGTSHASGICTNNFYVNGNLVSTSSTDIQTAAAYSSTYTYAPSPTATSISIRAELNPDPNYPITEARIGVNFYITEE